MAATNLPAAVTGNTFNADNEMTAFNGNTLMYDTAGNLTNDGSSTYSWDARNQLSAITGGVAAAFAHGPFGRRMSKTISGTATSFLYDGLNPVQELQNGAPSSNMLTGLGIDEYFQRADSGGASDLHTSVPRFPDIPENRSKSARVRAICDRARFGRVRLQGG